MIMLLLENGADVKVKGRIEATAAYHGAANGHEAVVETLLTACTDDNDAGYSGGQTALEAAAEGGHGAVVEKQLATGADVNSEAAGGRTLLQVAIARGHEAGTDVPAAAASSRKALQETAKGGQKESRGETIGCNYN
jgi:ankyrin repeat protein